MEWYYFFNEQTMTTYPTERSNARGGFKPAKRHQDAVKHSWLLGWVRHLVRLSFWYFLRWLRGPVGIGQGIAQTISLGCWEPSWALKMEGWFLDYSWEVSDLI
jgi:hypothetical protein